jgi:ABC-type transporter Mla subunit MlaD
VDASDAVQLADLQALADGLRSDDPQIQAFVAAALECVETLHQRAAALERSSESPGSFHDVNHRQRLDALIVEQAESIERLQACLERVRALRDLASWSAQRNGGQADDAVIRVGDLTRALRPAD